jgi:hypothetical protein
LTIVTSRDSGNLRAVLAVRGFRRLLGVRLSSQFTDGLFQAALAGSVLFNPDRQTSALAIAAGTALLVAVLADRPVRRGAPGPVEPSAGDRVHQPGPCRPRPTGRGDGSVRTPFKRRRFRPKLSRRQKAVNRAHAKIRARGERAIATLKTWKILVKLRCCPRRATAIVQPILVLHHVESNRYAG